MSRTYTVAQKPRTDPGPRPSSSIYDKPKTWRQLRPNAAIRGDTPSQEEPNSSLLSQTPFIATICLAQLCAQAGIGQTLPIMKGVSSRFRVGNANNLSSSIAGYSIALGTVVLIASRLGDIFGHKRIFIMGLAWSAGWCLIVGASFYSNQSLFIASRAFQGLGAAFTLPTGLALLRATRPIGMRKTVIFTLYAAMSPIGLIIGALGASLIVKVAWWPWAYWAFSVTLFVLGIISNFTISLARRTHKLLPGSRAVILELDIPGMITGSTSLGLFGFAWCQAQAVGWQEAYLWIILIMSGILAALFGMIETCYAPRPLIPYSALKWEVFWILVIIGCGWSCFGIWMFYGWQFVEQLRSTSPLLTTRYFSPLLAVGCLAAMTTRFVLYRIGRHALLCVAMLSIMVGGAIISTMRIRQTYWQQLFISVLFIAWGVYTSVPVATLMILKTVNKKHGGIAASLVCTVTYYGMGLGLGVAGTVERNMLSGKSTVKNRLKGYRAVYWTSVGLATFGFVVCLGLAWASWLRKSDRRRHSPGCDCESGGYH
ncbi:major facilitator superfamily domain-containing protein [Xylaria digitata]|nr:major facilitator superfamily domain-containing protein [Xylaria digitata]